MSMSQWAPMRPHGLAVPVNEALVSCCQCYVRHAWHSSVGYQMATCTETPWQDYVLLTHVLWLRVQKTPSDGATTQRTQIVGDGMLKGDRATDDQWSLSLPDWMREPSPTSKFQQSNLPQTENYKRDSGHKDNKGRKNRQDIQLLLEAAWNSRFGTLQEAGCNTMDSTAAQTCWSLRKCVTL